jgi:nicotinamidase-related amidase
MNIPPRFSAANTVLVLIDFQEKLFPAMHDKDKLLGNVLKLIQGVKVLEIPVVVTEQYPQGLGPTLPEIKALLPDIEPVDKFCFSCGDEPRFIKALRSLKRTQLLIAGIEAHICVYQTASALAHAGYSVQVVSDCIASRDPKNQLVTLYRLGEAGIPPTTLEMALFELLKVAEGEKFKQISAIVK